MKKTLLLFLGLCLLLLASCQKDEGELAGRVAQVAYADLFKGNDKALIDNTLGADSLPEAYREQLRLQARQFLQHQDSLHGGVKAVTLQRTELSEDKQKATAFLLLQFGDSLKEEVAVPLVKQNKNWYLR